MTKTSADFNYRIAILGCPSQPDVKWSYENITRLKELGFNTVQLNIAWGSRPADEALNLEDILLLPGMENEAKHQTSSPERVAERAAELKKRSEICKDLGLRTLFHFGAPYNGISGYRNEKLSRCLLDKKTLEYYARMLEVFAEEFRDVDDVLIYTYDQDAWLCDEFGQCENCYGIPVDQRVAEFINTLGEIWKSNRPDGRLWWEPWELSAGQVLQCIGKLNPKFIGLMLHSNVAEVMATLPVDRFVKNACQMAFSRSIPVIIEGFLGAASEELEPFRYMSYPLVTLRQLKAIVGVNGVVGIKEYYGLIPIKEDPNLRITSLFFRNFDIDEDDALQELATLYGDCKTQVIEFWHHCSSGMELFPWDVSWFARKQGYSDFKHTLNAAFLRGQMCHTPSWESSRRCIYMKTDNQEPDPWLLEDIQLRCLLSADHWSEALMLGQNIVKSVPVEIVDNFKLGLVELSRFTKVCLSYAYHIRETNLTYLIKQRNDVKEEIPQRIIDELKDLLIKDKLNQGESKEIEDALKMLESNLDEFIIKYFTNPEKDEWVIGPHSFTSR